MYAEAEGKKLRCGAGRGARCTRSESVKSMLLPQKYPHLLVAQHVACNELHSWMPKNDRWIRETEDEDEGRSDSRLQVRPTPPVLIGHSSYYAFWKQVIGSGGSRGKGGKVTKARRRRRCQAALITNRAVFSQQSDYPTFKHESRSQAGATRRAKGQ